MTLKTLKIPLAISFFVAGLLIVPAFCFGAVSYERSPSGYEIQNPVSFDVSFDDFEIDTECSDEIYSYWGITASAYEEGEDWYSDEFYASTTQSQIIVGTLPLGEYSAVSFTCSISGTQVDNVAGFIEGTATEPIFEVVAGAELQPLFTLPTGFVASSTAYIGSYATDLQEPLKLIVGTGMAMWVIGWVLGKFTSRGRTKR